MCQETTTRMVAAVKPRCIWTCLRRYGWLAGTTMNERDFVPSCSCVLRGSVTVFLFCVFSFALVCAVQMCVCDKQLACEHDVVSYEHSRGLNTHAVKPAGEK